MPTGGRTLLHFKPERGDPRSAHVWLNDGGPGYVWLQVGPGVVRLDRDAMIHLAAALERVVDEIARLDPIYGIEP